MVRSPLVTPPVMQYELHGAALEVHADDASLARDASALLSGFQTIEGQVPAARVRLVSVTREDLPEQPGPEARLLARGEEAGGVAWPWAVFREDDSTVIVWDDRAHLRLDRDRRSALLRVCDPPSLTAEQRASLLFFAVSELLRQRGLIAIHAAAVERDGQAVLILGPPGAGKTTAMLSLLHAGWRLLSDDHPLLRDRGDGGIDALPFAVPARLTRETIERFAGRLTGIPAAPAHGKASVAIDAVAPSGIGTGARPAALLLPEIVEWPTTRLLPVSRAQALEEVLRLTLGLATAEPAVARRHFGLLGRLVRETPCCRLMSGARVEDDLPLAVESMLQAVAA